MRLGILGGTFNPPHLGHLAIASRAFSQLGLERVALMPLHTPPHKGAFEDPGPRHRLRMCQLAVQERPGLSACALEIERGGPSYTVDTLLALHALAPQIQLTLILGSDMARTLPSWREPSRLAQLAHLAIAERQGDGRVEVLDALGSPAHSFMDIAFLKMPTIDVSSSIVRTLVGLGEPVEELVGAAVSAYISEHRLYRHPAGATTP